MIRQQLELPPHLPEPPRRATRSWSRAGVEATYLEETMKTIAEGQLIAVLRGSRGRICDEEAMPAGRDERADVQQLHCEVHLDDGVESKVTQRARG